MKALINKFRLSFSLAVAAHIVILSFMFANFQKKHKLSQAAVIQAKAVENKIEDKPIIKSSLIDKKSVAQAVARQEQVEINRKREIEKELSQLKKIKQQTIQQKQEQKELAKAKEQLLQEKQKTEADKKILDQQVAKVINDKKKLEQEKALALKAKKQAIAAKEKAIAEQKQIIEAKKKADALRKKIEDELAAKAAMESTQRHNKWIENEVSRYQEIFREDIENNRTLSTAFANNLTTTFRLKLMPDGNILSIMIQKSSGNIAYDSQQERAIYKSAPFEMPQDPEVLRRVQDIILSLSNDLSRIS